MKKLLNDVTCFGMKDVLECLKADAPFTKMKIIDPTTLKAYGKYYMYNLDRENKTITETTMKKSKMDEFVSSVIYQYDDNYELCEEAHFGIEDDNQTPTLIKTIRYYTNTEDNCLNEGVLYCKYKIEIDAKSSNKPGVLYGPMPQRIEIKMKSGYSIKPTECGVYHSNDTFPGEVILIKSQNEEIRILCCNGGDIETQPFVEHFKYDDDGKLLLKRNLLGGVEEVYTYDDNGFIIFDVQREIEDKDAIYCNTAYGYKEENGILFQHVVYTNYNCTDDGDAWIDNGILCVNEYRLFGNLYVPAGLCDYYDAEGNEL